VAQCRKGTRCGSGFFGCAKSTGGKKTMVNPSFQQDSMRAPSHKELHEDLLPDFWTARGNGRDMPKNDFDNLAEPISGVKKKVCGFSFHPRLFSFYPELLPSIQNRALTSAHLLHTPGQSKRPLWKGTGIR
jgi:hypothetical protein